MEAPVVFAWANVGLGFFCGAFILARFRLRQKRARSLRALQVLFGVFPIYFGLVYLAALFSLFGLDLATVDATYLRPAVTALLALILAGFIAVDRLI